MIEIKQLQYFAACARTGSISQAAEELYTTQPNVSRTIKAMEAEMGAELFERYTRGIRLTARGEYVYQYAKRILESLEKLEQKEEAKEALLSISCSPSSWFADQFARFYGEKREEELKFRVYSGSTREIVQRVQERADDLGFLYVMKSQQSAFSYYLSRNYLEYQVLGETEVMLYPGKKHPWWQEKDKETLENIQLIQRFPDEFSPENGLFGDARTAVTTNSDYIMERLLKNSSLVNISGNYFTDKKEQYERGVVLSGKENPVLFGAVKRKGEALSKWGDVFLEYLKKAMKKS